jgi:hypothetical protein
MNTLVGGEMRCRVCGLPQRQPIWGLDGACPTYDICACCGCEFGNEDSLPEGIRRHRETWMASGEWFDREKRPNNWSKQQQLQNVPQF